MVHNLALFLIFGQPLIVYLGILTLLLVLSTATVGYLNFHGRFIIPFKWHPRLAFTTIAVALIHCTLGLSIFLNF